MYVRLVLYEFVKSNDCQFIDDNFYSLLTRKQPRRKVLTLTKSFMLKVAALIQSLKSYYTIKEFDRKRELLDSLKKLLVVSWLKV